MTVEQIKLVRTEVLVAMGERFWKPSAIGIGLMIAIAIAAMYWDITPVTARLVALFTVFTTYAIWAVPFLDRLEKIAIALELKRLEDK